MISNPYRFIDAFSNDLHGKGDEPEPEVFDNALTFTDEIVLLTALNWNREAQRAASLIEEAHADNVLAWSRDRTDYWITDVAELGDAA